MGDSHLQITLHYCKNKNQIGSKRQVLATSVRISQRKFETSCEMFTGHSRLRCHTHKMTICSTENCRFCDLMAETPKHLFLVDQWSQYISLFYLSWKQTTNNFQPTLLCISPSPLTPDPCIPV